MQNMDFFQSSYFKERNNVLNVAFGKVLRVMKNLYKKRVLFKPPTTDSPTHQPTIINLRWNEDRITNMLCIL